MEKLNFKEILLRTAVCAIACDGDIVDREKEALYNIEKNSPYFSSEDLSTSLDKLIKNCTGGFQSFKDELFKSLDEVELNIVEELTLLEISFRIIAADEIEQRYSDWPDGEGFGSSDHNFAIKELMGLVGYEFDESEAIDGGQFLGLGIDNDNQEELTEKRINEWVEKIIDKFI